MCKETGIGYTLQWSYTDRYGYTTTASVPIPESCDTFSKMMAQARISATLLGAPVTIVDEDGEDVITVLNRSNKMHGME